MLPSSLVDVRLKKAPSKHMALNRSHSIKIESTFWIIFDFNSLMEFLKKGTSNMSCRVRSMKWVACLVREDIYYGIYWLKVSGHLRTTDSIVLR